MNRKQHDEWIERLRGLEKLHSGNIATIKEFEESLRIFQPSLVDEWNTLNHWEKLRLIEFIVKGSAKIMVTR